MPKTAELGRPVTVFIADASRMKSQLMVAALQRSRHRIVVVGSAADSIGIHKGLRENRADVAVISAELRDGPIVGLQVAREARVSYPATRIIMTVDSCAASIVVEAFRAGAHGILSRDDPFEMLCKCIRAVYEGQVWANSEQLNFLVEALAKNAPPARIANVQGTSLLTQREEDLVELVAQGLTNRDISQQLKLSEHTVRNYLFRIFNKVGTSSRLELALYTLNRREDVRPNVPGEVGNPPDLSRV
jgi:two-component system nitrate/nitrite response regulator NarL